MRVEGPLINRYSWIVQLIIDYQYASYVLIGQVLYQLHNIIIIHN